MREYEVIGWRGVEHGDEDADLRRIDGVERHGS